MRALLALLLALLACSAPPPAAAGLDASAPARSLRAKLLGRSSWLASSDAAALSSHPYPLRTPADASTDVTLCASVVAGAAGDLGAGGECSLPANVSAVLPAGARVLTVMAPAGDGLPRKVPCGPRSTST